MSDTWSAAYQMNAFKMESTVVKTARHFHINFAMFQATFAIITPALIIGGLLTESSSAQ